MREVKTQNIEPCIESFRPVEWQEVAQILDRYFKWSQKDFLMCTMHGKRERKGLRWSCHQQKQARLWKVQGERGTEAGAQFRTNYI